MTQSEAKKSTPTKQGGKKDYEVGNKKPPKERQFGQPNGNPRHNGAWKKEDTLRYKWEQLLKLSDDELREVLKDPNIGRVEKMTAEVLLDRAMKPTEKIYSLDKLATQVYGQPKAPIEVTELEAPVPLSPRKKKAK